MSFKKYCKDHLLSLVLFLIVLFLISSLCIAFKINYSVLLAIVFVLLIFGSFNFLFEYYRRKHFYQQLLHSLESLDKKYLIAELILQPSFLEGNILEQVLYEATKSMNEHINKYKTSLDDFKDYLEMWIHEVKIPLASLLLSVHNKKELNDPMILEQVKKLEDFVDQVLYYVRSENANQDYLIKSYDLKKIVNDVLMRNKDSLLYHSITVKGVNLNQNVLTDSKWLQFIINQIINNSIKYKKDVASTLTISASKKENVLILSIKDNGIGIKKSDLPLIFQKSFTGHNGRICSSSTGMGLYICQNLCKKLGHKIEVTSIEEQFTEVSIYFTEDGFYDTVN